MIPEFFIVVGSYIAVFFLATLVFNFLMAGFLRTYLIVKGSRGAKVLVQVVTVSRNYYKAGFVEDGFLVYTDAGKHEKRLSIPDRFNPFYRSLNVTCINVDEQYNIIILPKGQVVEGFDADKYNSLYLRALYRPALLDPKQQLMFVLSIITTLLAVATFFILMFVTNKKLDTAIDISTQIFNRFANVTQTI